VADFDFIQARHADGSGTTVDLAYNSTVTLNSLLIAAVGGDANVAISSVAKNAGTATVSAWTKAVGSADTQFQQAELWYAQVTGAGSLTLRVTYASSVSNARFGIGEYADPGTITLQDTAAAKTVSGTSQSSGNVTFTAAGLLVGVMTPTSTAVAATAGSGFTIRARSGLDDFNFEDKKVASAGSDDADWTISPADECNLVAAAFQGTGGGGGVALRRRGSLGLLGVGR
jgi:hypothetical protein